MSPGSTDYSIDDPDTLGDERDLGAKAEKPKKPVSRRRQKVQHQFPVEPRVVVVVKKPRTIMNHSYRDFSIVPASLDWEEPKSIEEMTFSQKVHSVLSNEEFALYISWMPHGRAFRIRIPKVFEEQICPKYFGHSRYSSFLRMLNNFGFKHLTKGPDRNCYYHECFLRGMPHLCQYMPLPRNARRLLPDPDNEPDFYHLSRVFPLPDKRPKPVPELEQQQHQQQHSQIMVNDNSSALANHFGAMNSAAQDMGPNEMQRLLMEQRGMGMNQQQSIQQLQFQHQQQQAREPGLMSGNNLGATLNPNTLPSSSNQGPAGNNGNAAIELALRRQHLINQLQQQQQQSTTAVLLETLNQSGLRQHPHHQGQGNNPFGGASFPF